MNGKIILGYTYLLFLSETVISTLNC